MSAEPSGWTDDTGLVSFFEAHRNRPEDLYPSERRFLPWLARQTSTVLDVGCATGGFAGVWTHFNRDIRYAGVDVSAQLIDSARRMHPGLEFLVGDCAEGLALSSQAADVVQALGWLHWEPRYRAALAELWRLAGRWLFFDVRLIDSDSDLADGCQRLAFEEFGDQGNSTPYVCAAWSAFAALLSELEPASVFAYGYWGRPAETVLGVDQDVCFATFVLGRGPRPDGATRVACELPLPWPEAWARGVERLPTGWLDANVAPGPAR